MTQATPIDLDKLMDEGLHKYEFAKEYVAAQYEEIERLERELAEAKAVIDTTKVKLAELLPELDKISYNVGVEEAAKVVDEQRAIEQKLVEEARQSDDTALMKTYNHCQYVLKHRADAIRALVKP